MPSSYSVCLNSRPAHPKVHVQTPKKAAPELQAQADKTKHARALSHSNSGRIGALHPDQAALALAAADAFPALRARAPAAPARLAGAWAARQQAEPAADVSFDAVDVLPMTPAPAAPYVPPALRAGASASTLAGCSAPCPAIPAAAPRSEPYIPPHHRTAEQQAAAAAAPRPGRPCPFPALVAGPLPAPLPTLLPLYRLALLYPSQPLRWF